MFIVTVGATTSGYISAIKEMNLFFSEDIVVVARGVIVIYAFPIGGTLQENMVDRIKIVEGVETAVPMLFIITPKQEGVLQLIPTNVSIGIPSGNWSVLLGSTPLEPGGNWPSEDPNKKEVVIGQSLAAQFNLTIGSKTKIKNHDLNIVGILDTPSILLSRSIIMPLRLSQVVYGYNELVNMVIVKPSKGVTQEELAQKIEMQIGSVKALTCEERNEIVLPALSDIETWNLGIRAMLFFLNMILVANVATMNISERRRDFATLAAIGAPRNSIFRIVITETILIGLFGGLLGLLLGTVATLLLASLYTNIPLTLFLPSLFDIVSPIFMIEILAFTVVVSSIAGIIPAINAMRANISEVLRSEY